VGKVQGNGETRQLHWGITPHPMTHTGLLARAINVEKKETSWQPGKQRVDRNRVVPVVTPDERKKETRRKTGASGLLRKG